METSQSMELFTLNHGILPIIANLPHSGLFVPEPIAASMRTQHLQALPNSDWHLNMLYDFLPQLGITMMVANYNRYVVDLNRELKQPIAGDFWSAVVPLKTAFGKHIYQTTIEDNITERIANYYLPYHYQLNQLIESTLNQFGKVYLLDLHSFGGLVNEQICLGNLKGKSCSNNFMTIVGNALIKEGYQVVQNKVFTGGYITKHYSQIPNVEVLQVEVRYSVYLEKEQINQPFIPNWNCRQFHLTRIKFQRVFKNIVNQLQQTL